MTYVYAIQTALWIHFKNIVFLGMTCFRDVNKPCCEPAVCQYHEALEKNMQLWMRCFEDDKCEVFEDDSSSEEDDDSSEETINNGTVTIGKKFKVPSHLVPTVKSLIAKHEESKEDSEDDSEELNFSKLFNDTFIANLTNALLKDDDSDEDSDSSEEDELTILLQGIVNDFLSNTHLVQTTTPSPTSTTTESLLNLLYNTKHSSKTLFDTKSLAFNNLVDVKQQTAANQALMQSRSNSLLNSFHTKHNRLNGKSQKSTASNQMNAQIAELANSETMKILNALQLAQTVNMGSNTNQQTQQLDPLAAMIAESIASQFMPVPPAPLTVPQQSNTQKAAAGVVNMHHSLPNGGMLNLNINSQNIKTTTPAMPDLRFIASNIDPKSKLSPKLKRLQALIAKKKKPKAPMPAIPKAAMPVIPAPPINISATVSTTQSPLIPDMLNLMAAQHILSEQSSGNDQQQIMNILKIAGMQNTAASSPQTHLLNNAQMMTMLSAMGIDPAAATGRSQALNTVQNTKSGMKIGMQNTAANSQQSHLTNNGQMLAMLGVIGQDTFTAKQSQALNSVQNTHAEKARQAMNLLKIIKKKKANRKLKKAKKSKSTKQFLSLNKLAVNSLVKKDSSTRKAIKQLQALRMVTEGRNRTQNDDSDESSDSTDEIDDSDEKSNVTENALYITRNGTVQVIKRNTTDDDDDSDESDEEINLLLAEILKELSVVKTTTKRPTTTTPTTTTTTPMTTTATTSTTPSTTPVSSTTPTTTISINMLINSVLRHQQTKQNVLRSKQQSQNVLRSKKKSGQKKKLDLKALAWSDVVNYFKSKRGGVL